MTYVSPLGLDAAAREGSRLAALRSANVALRHGRAMQYTEGQLRWSGIDQRKRSWNGDSPSYADCSSFYTWCIWDATRWIHHKRGLEDTVNGLNWTAGYTGTMVQHGEVVSGSELLVADAVLYGWDESIGAPMHVAFYVGGGRVISHGNSEGPLLLPYNGVGLAINQFRRYIR